MTERLFHWLFGWVRFAVYGDGARFINVCAKKNEKLWGFEKREETLYLCCRAGSYRRLRPHARRSRVRLKCVEKHGLPFLIRPLLKRKGLIVGTAAGAFIFFYLSGFVWGVTVTGAETLSDAEVLKAAESAGIYSGAKIGSFSPKIAAHEIELELPGLKWAAVNTNGCFIEISISEAEATPQSKQEDKLSNIVASSDGRVVAIEAESGRPEVSIGDTVKKGDLLISGVYEEQLDSWDPRADNPHQTVGSARGSVTAEIYRSFTVEVSEKKKVKTESGESESFVLLNIFGLELPLGPLPSFECDCREWTEIKQLELLGVALPLKLQITHYVFLTEEERTLSGEELETQALLKLREAQRLELKEGSSIVKEELSFTRTDGIMILSSGAICREEIGEEREILVSTTKNNENF